MADLLATSPVIQALGYALVAFLWQGAAIGVLTVALAAASRRASSETRYAIGCVALVALVLAPIVTTAARLQDSPLTGGRKVSPPAATTTAAVRSDATASRLLRLDTTLVQDSRLPIVVAVWGAGVMLLGLHLVLGGIAVARAKQLSSPLVSTDRRRILERLRHWLSITLDVGLFESATIDVPAVIGWLRPAIILPVSALAGLSPSQLEAILAHELAHVRRHDYLVNVAQRVVETLLFYHPAVWWVSGWIRREREHCCDDIAASLCGDRLVYAHALHALETLRGNAPALAMGARGGELVHRIRRLVDRTPAPLPNWPGGVAMIVPIVAFLTIGSYASPPDVRAISAPASEDARAAVETPAVSGPAPVASTPTSALPRSAATSRSAERGRRAPAQAVGSAAGTVTDPSGGTLPGATVVLRSRASSEARATTTDVTGSFAIGDVPAGDYELDVSLPAFKRDRSTLHVTAGQRTTTSIRLQLGSVSEEINVVGLPGQTSPAAEMPRNLQTASDYLQAAKVYYSREAFADADQMLARAIELIRATRVEPAPRPPDPVGVVRVGGSVREPKKLYDVRPVYPSAELATGGEAIVRIQAIIARDGTVADAVVASAPSAFDASAIGAVRQWMFSPTQLNGVPVEVLMTVTVNFKVR